MSHFLSFLISLLINGVVTISLNSFVGTYFFFINYGFYSFQFIASIRGQCHCTPLIVKLINS